MTAESTRPAPAGFFKRLSAKLSAGSSRLTRGIRDLLPGRKIDAEMLEELETRLITADVGVAATTRILGELAQARRAQGARRRRRPDRGAARSDARDPGTGRAAAGRRRWRTSPYVILVVGINGAGKTTTIGKLAHRLINEGRSVMLASGDTFRAAAREQLAVWAERNGVAMIAQQSGAEPARGHVRRDAGGARAQASTC